MRVRVLLFAGLKEHFGAGAVDLDLEPSSTVRDAIEALGRRRSDLEKFRYAIAVNRRYADVATELSAGDELALIPPVSGG